MGGAASTNGYPKLRKGEQAVVGGNQVYARGATITQVVGTLSQFPKEGVDSNASVLALPRGGVLVRHSGGSVQFGIPPETIKDSLILGIGVPTTFVILGEEMFDRDLGINVAEVEFPAYFNFFVNQKKVTIITVKSVEDRVRKIFQETLLGPRESDYDISEDFHPSLPGGLLSKNNPDTCWPDFTREGLALDKNRESMTVDRLFDFRLLDGVGAGKERGKIVLDAAHNVVLKYNSATKKFTVRENNKNIAQVDSKFLRPRSFLKLYFTPQVFIVPRFGVTMLGSSHGFDPSGTTTGFIVWVNYRGIVVDPPAQSPELLQGMGIHSRLIDGMILTHCHADHDAGAFQKILMEEPINVYTTRTIMNSFIRKYSAVSGLDPLFLRQLFHFQPVVIGEYKHIHGGRWDFFYSLHVIPTIGFEVRFEGEGIVYSGDTRTDESLFATMAKERAIGRGRHRHLTEGSPFARATFSHDPKEALKSAKHRLALDYQPFVFHEAGVPPIHTPLENLAKLDKAVRDRLFVVHTNEAQVKKLYTGTLQVAAEWSTIHISTAIEQKDQLEFKKDTEHGNSYDKDGTSQASDAVSEGSSSDLNKIDSKSEVLQLTNLLSATTLFEKLVGADKINQEKGAQLVRLGRLAMYKKGSVIARKGDTWDRCIVVRAGVAEEKSGTLAPELLLDEDEPVPVATPGSPATYKSKPTQKPYEHMSKHKHHFVGDVLGELSLVGVSDYFRRLKRDKPIADQAEGCQSVPNGVGADLASFTFPSVETLQIETEEENRLDSNAESLPSHQHSTDSNNSDIGKPLSGNNEKKSVNAEKGSSVKPSTSCKVLDQVREVVVQEGEGYLKETTDLTSTCPQTSASAMDQLRLVRHDVVAIEDVYAIEFTPEAIKPFFRENDMGELVLKQVVKLAKCRNRASWEIFRYNRMISQHATQMQKQTLQLILSEPTPVENGTVLQKSNTIQEFAWLIAEGKLEISEFEEGQSEAPAAEQSNPSGPDGLVQKEATKEKLTITVDTSPVTKEDPACAPSWARAETIYAGKGALVCDVNALLQNERSLKRVIVRSKYTMVYPIPKDKLLEFINQFPGIKVLWLDSHVVR